MEKFVIGIDGDIVCYRCAASAENEIDDVAIDRCDDLINRIASLFNVQSGEYSVYLTGSNNFRYKLYSEYKATRKDKPKPRHLGTCREYLADVFKAKVSDGCEADDLLAIAHTKNPEHILCSIDKDFLQLPGTHFDFVKNVVTTVTPQEATYNFFVQMVLGDRSDNIPGFDGKMRTDFPKKFEYIKNELQSLKTYEEMFRYVRELYYTDEAFLASGGCLWLQRYEDEDWQSSARLLMETFERD